MSSVRGMSLLVHVLSLSISFMCITDYKMAKSMRGNHQSSHNGDFSHEAYVQYMAKQVNLFDKASVYI